MRVVLRTSELISAVFFGYIGVRETLRSSSSMVSATRVFRKDVQSNFAPWFLFLLLFIWLGVGLSSLGAAWWLLQSERTKDL